MNIYIFDEKYRMLKGMRISDDKNPVLATNETLIPIKEYTPKCYQYYDRTEGNNWHYDWTRRPCLSYEVDDLLTFEIEQLGNIIPENFDEENFTLLKKKKKQDIYLECEIELKERNNLIHSNVIDKTINCKESEISHLKGIDRIFINETLKISTPGLVKIYNTREKNPDITYITDPIDLSKQVPFRLFDDSYIMVTLEQLKNIRNEIINELVKIKNYKFTIYSKIDRCSSSAELKKIEWSWPLIN